jgi:hypothetical protein
MKNDIMLIWCIWEVDDRDVGPNEQREAPHIDVYLCYDKKIFKNLYRRGGDIHSNRVIY